MTRQRDTSYLDFDTPPFAVDETGIDAGDDGDEADAFLPTPMRTAQYWHESSRNLGATEHALQIENVVSQERHSETTFRVVVVSDVAAVPNSVWRHLYVRAAQLGRRSMQVADKMVNVVESLRYNPSQIACPRLRTFRVPRVLWHHQKYEPRNISAWYTERLSSPTRLHPHEREPDDTFFVRTRIVPHFGTAAEPITYYSPDELAARWPVTPSQLPLTAIRFVHAFCFSLVAHLSVV